MAFHSIVPSAPLDGVIESIWDWCVPCAPPSLDRILPVPNAGIIINLAEDRTRMYADAPGHQCSHASGSVFSGPYTHSFLIDGAEQQRVMGVIFRPGGALPFVKEPVDRLSDRDTDLEDLFGGRARILRERLLEAGSSLSRLMLLESWLHGLAPDVRPEPSVAHAFAALRESPGMRRIRDVAAECGVSPRRLGTLFRTQIGLGPKRLARLLRFRAVLADAGSRSRIEWARVAADCGFHDQAHLVHEFRRFSGMTPSAWSARRDRTGNHVPLDPDQDDVFLQDLGDLPH